MKEIRRRGGALRTAGIFALGAAVGSVIALLYAPASGQVTRKRLVMRARNLKRAALRRLGQTGRALTTRAARVRDAATEWFAERVGHRNGRQTIRRPVRHAHAN
ncbi:MAG: YtxH domain-containing protein [Candidatus Omnitrophica bacterium]|nr:YtxH domain-containing protein [Candidatus Omnitrophota bacterium]